MNTLSFSLSPSPIDSLGSTGLSVSTGSFPVVFRDASLAFLVLLISGCLDNYYVFLPSLYLHYTTHNIL